MLRIQRSASNQEVIFSLSGSIESEDIKELHRLLKIESEDQNITLDLQEIMLINREALKFLTQCEAENIHLKNCPAYIREWIDREIQQTS
jgi:hypothetical protein